VSDLTRNLTLHELDERLSQKSYDLGSDVGSDSKNITTKANIQIRRMVPSP